MTALLRPQLTKLTLSYVKEAAYGTEVVDGSVTKRFDFLQPNLADLTQEAVNDSDIIKGHEFQRDDVYNILINQDITKPFEFVASAELLGLILSMAHGTVVAAGSGPYTHTITALNAATTDQLPSISMAETINGDTATYWKYKGVVVNDYMISCENRGRITCSGSFITDGSQTAKTSFSIPASPETTNPMSGKDALFKWANAGSGVVDQSSLLRGFKIGWNNNVDKGDARGQIGTGTAYLGCARFGNRQPTLTVKVWGNHGDAFHTDFVARTLKIVEITLAGPNSTSVVFTFTRCKLMSAKPGFDGIRNTLDLEFEFYSTTTTTVTPVSIVATNSIAAYLT